MNPTVLNFGHWYLFELCILVLGFFMTLIKLKNYLNPASYLIK